jgi:hypothetical protein
MNIHGKHFDAVDMITDTIFSDGNIFYSDVVPLVLEK